MSIVEADGDQVPAAQGQHEAPATDETGRRVRLANDRTYLAWGRTSLAFFGLALAVGRIVPGLDRSVSRWQFEALGCAYAALGVAAVLYGLRRHRVVEQALVTGGSVEVSTAALVVFTLLIALVGLATFAVMIVD